MIRTLGDIKNEVLVRLNASTSTAFYTDTILGDFINDAHRWATSYKKWPFTEGKETTTFVSEEYAYPESWKSDSIRLLQVDGKWCQKMEFNDYQTYREDNPAADDRIFTDFGRRYFVNPEIDASGTITVWGQYNSAELDKSVPGTTTFFSDAEEEGNKAIMYEALSFAMLREKKFNESDYYHKKAVEILNEIWERVSAEQYGYHTRKDKSIFKRMDVLGGALRDDLLKRDQFI